MIKSSFCLFKGLSESAETRIWQAGILTWEHFLMDSKNLFSNEKTRFIKEQIFEADIAFKAGLCDYFIKRFPPAQRIRVLKDFYGKTGFVDIETTGLSSKDKITMIACRRNAKTEIYTADKDLSGFLSSFHNLDLIVTFNGERFDMPRLKTHFNMDFPCSHLDMMHIMHGFGYKGGQKSIEKRLGFRRKFTECADGRTAVTLWEKYCNTGDARYLEKLHLYNKEDVAALEMISIWAYNQSMSTFPLAVTFG